MRLYSVYDTKVKAFANPVICRNDGEAIRGFSGAVNGGDTYISKHYLDFALFCVGEWDDEKGEITPENRSVIRGLEVKTLDDKAAAA